MIHILIVEDEKPISELMRMSLRKAGYQCTCVFNGEQAADVLEKRSFDLILLDAVMPDLSGPEVLCRLRVRGVTVPALAVTGLDAGDPALAGFDEVLTKPLTGASLGAALLRHLPAEKIRYD